MNSAIVLAVLVLLGLLRRPAWQAALAGFAGGDCRVHIITTDTQMIEDTPAEYKVRMQKHADKILGAGADAAQAAGVACETVQVEREHPYQAIIDTADLKGCDLIVMASHGRHGISAIVLGSETVKVLTHCKIPVLVHR